MNTEAIDPLIPGDTCPAMVWSAVERRTTRTVKVTKPRSQLSESEIGPLGCTPCRDDQVQVTLVDGHSLTLCKAVAAPVREALDEGLAQGAVIDTILGYRASMSRVSSCAWRTTRAWTSR